MRFETDRKVNIGVAIIAGAIAFSNLIREFGTIGFMQRTRHPLESFSKVGIDMGGRSSSGGGATTVYSAVLIGTKNIKIPNGGTDLSEVEDVAKRISNYLELPCEPEPRMGFFGKRL